MGEVGARLRSSAITLPTIAVLAAAALTSCSSRAGAQQQVCVDANQNVIDQRQCTQPGGTGRYYYYNSGSSFSSGIGSHISGGSFTSHGASAAAAAAAAARVGRGGFGGHAAGG